MNLIDKLNKVEGTAMKLHQVKALAQEVARALKNNTTPTMQEPVLNNKPIKHGDLLDAIIGALEWVRDDQRTLFLWTVGKEFGGLQVFQVVQEYERVRLGIRMVPIVKLGGKKVAEEVKVEDWSLLSGISWHNRNGISVPDNFSIVAPISTVFEIESETYTVTWQTYTETSDARGRERSIEVYVSGQIGASIPLSKVISFDVNAGVKVGEKRYDTHEQRNVTAQGKQLSRNFVVTKLGRNCLLYSPGIVNKPVVNPVAVQNGYNLELKDAPATPKQGPFWNAYDLTAAQTYLGHAQATDAMQRMIDDIGLELARRSQGAYANTP